MRLSEKDTTKVQVTVLFFGAARDLVGHDELRISLAAATAGEALAELLEQFPDLRRFGRSLLFAVNQEYAQPDRELKDGDELALFPPVSGGSGEATSAEGAEDSSPGRKPGDQAANRSEALEEGDRNPTTAPHQSEFSNDFYELTTEAIDVGAVARRVVLPECGATVTLDGYAREWTSGRRTLHLVYEAYAPMALRELERLGREAHAQFEIAHLGIVHRTGKLEMGETSVVIAVSAPHRGAAFAACEWAIRELKRAVPIWKKEVFEDGEVWVEGEQPE